MTFRVRVRAQVQVRVKGMAGLIEKYKEDQHRKVAGIALER